MNINTSAEESGWIDVGEECLIEFKVKVNDIVSQGALISNQAVLTAKGDGVAEDSYPLSLFSDDLDTEVIGDATTCVVGSSPIINAQKIVSDENGGELASGDLLTYEIIITNNGKVVQQMLSMVILFLNLPHI